MQKLPEAPDRRKGDACATKRTIPTKEKFSFPFRSDQRSDKTEIILASGKRRHASISRQRVG